VRRRRRLAPISAPVPPWLHPCTPSRSWARDCLIIEHASMYLSPTTLHAQVLNGESLSPLLLSMAMTDPLCARRRRHPSSPALGAEAYSSPCRRQLGGALPALLGGGLAEPSERRTSFPRLSAAACRSPLCAASPSPATPLSTAYSAAAVGRPGASPVRRSLSSRRGADALSWCELVKRERDVCG
jgi:hypothetical protein